MVLVNVFPWICVNWFRYIHEFMSPIRARLCRIYGKLLISNSEGPLSNEWLIFTGLKTADCLNFYELSRNKRHKVIL